MKNLLFTLLLFIGYQNSSFAQLSCDELQEYVEDKDFGMTYYSFSSTAINKVSFHEIMDESYNSYYYAIVTFQSNLYNSYIYQVSSTTKWNYSSDYISSAGEAFWEHIHPYRNNLGCAPDLD
jgi:hypothetical protein